MPPGTQPIDAGAAQRQRRRLGLAPEAPWLHQEVATRMLERLPVIKLQPQQVLQSRPLQGGGDEGLREHYPHARQLWLEPDDTVRARAQQRLRGGRLQAMWQTVKQGLGGAAATELLATAGQDQAQLLWSNMELHGEADKPGLLAGWHRALSVDGFLMFSCLGPDSFVELRPLYAAEGWGDPAPPWMDMHDLGDLLVHAGFADPVMDQEHLRLTWGRPADLLRDLRALGGNLAASRFAGLRGRAWQEKLLQRLEQLRGPDGRLVLSVELVYGHAFKPKPRLKLAEHTEISLDQMRSMVRKTGKN